MERGSSISRIVGKMPEEERAHLMEQATKVFQNQEPLIEKLRGAELEKTHEEISIIQHVNEQLKKQWESYGGTFIQVPPENIHLIRADRWGAASTGFYDWDQQAVFLIDQGSLIWFAHCVGHELTHFESHNAIQLTNEDQPRYDRYRSGLSANSRDGKQKHLLNINEAVIEILNIQNVKELLSNPLFKKEVEITRVNAQSFPNEVTEETIFFSVDSETGDHQKFSYFRKRERQMLNRLIVKILEANPGTFTSSDQVFDIFAKAAITGNILPIGRLIDGTFGPGTLRRIGSLDNDLGAQLALVESLAPTQSADSTRK